ncbi:2-methylfumaryl-CoA isomerase [Xylophilus rhododendri]|uniref:2-methylfumaryl-CoA isomerase n=1 Tax=Xylophilus rhododendri TaxID=2697032 RepID=A0A857JCB3_9BURK|nr:2-methylfumaryl-CoA isomerase [Xylophilus rhododendri]
MLPILDGLRVVEATAFIAAPLGGLTLAQFGADVIRIDPPGGSLDIGRWPLADDGRTSLFWTGLNKGKRSVVIDTAQPEGRELAMALIAAPGEDAGILLTNLPPRGFLSYEDLSALRPDLIQLTLSGDRHGGSQVDYTVNARLGVPLFTGDAQANGLRPVNHVMPAWDVGTGYLAALGILGAERHRRKTGRGQHVKLALQDVGLATLGNLGFIAEAESGRPRQRIGNDLFGAFGGDFACRDGEHLMIVGLTGRQWRGLCKACGLQPAMDALGERLGLDLSQEGARFVARRHIAELVGPWVAARSKAEVTAAFDANGVCWGPYQTVEQLVAQDAECSTANPLFQHIEQPGAGRTLAPGLPLDYSELGRSDARPAARLGQHSEEVLHEVLGLDGAAIGALIDRGLVRTA